MIFIYSICIITISCSERYRFIFYFITSRRPEAVSRVSIIMDVIWVSSITIAWISAIAITWIPIVIIIWISSISVTRIASVIVWSICWSCWISAVVVGISTIVIGISTIVVGISSIVWVAAIVIWISTIIISIIIISISTISSILLIDLVTSVSSWSYACFIRIKFLLSIERVLSIR